MFGHFINNYPKTVVANLLRIHTSVTRIILYYSSRLNKFNGD